MWKNGVQNAEIEYPRNKPYKPSFFMIGMIVLIPWLLTPLLPCNSEKNPTYLDLHPSLDYLQGEANRDRYDTGEVARDGSDFC